MKKEQTAETQNKKGASAAKAIINVIIYVLIFLVLITSIVIAVMALTSKASGISTVFGYTIQPIQSDSMKGGSPDGYGGKDFEKGDLMIAKATNFDENAEYHVGDIVTFRKLDTDGTTMLIAHRIVNVAKDSTGQTCYQTWGDNREMDTVPDQELIGDYLLAGDIGSVYYSADYEGVIIKGFGGFLDYLKTQQGFFLVVLLPMIIFFLYVLVRVVLNMTEYRKAKADEEKDQAVAAALAEKEKEIAVLKPEDMTPEQLEQFKKFLEQQKAEGNSSTDAE